MALTIFSDLTCCAAASKRPAAGANTVLYTTKGQPCYMHVVRSLGDADGVNPMVVGWRVETSPSALLALYPGVIRKRGACLSLPGEDPVEQRQLRQLSPALPAATANGLGIDDQLQTGRALGATLCLQKRVSQPNGKHQLRPAARTCRLQGLWRGDGLAIPAVPPAKRGEPRTAPTHKRAPRQTRPGA